MADSPPKILQEQVVWMVALFRKERNTLHLNHNISLQIKKRLPKGIISCRDVWYSKITVMLLIIMLVLLVFQTNTPGWTRVSDAPEPSAIKQFPVEITSKVEEDLTLVVNCNKWLCSITTHRIDIISSKDITRITHNWWKVLLLIIDLCKITQAKWTAALRGIRHQLVLVLVREPWVTPSGICSTCSQYNSSRWRSKGTSCSTPRWTQSKSRRFSHHRTWWTKRWLMMPTQAATPQVRAQWSRMRSSWYMGA